MNALEILAIAMVMDALIGEPKVVWDRIPHPVIVMGRGINWCDRTFNKGKSRVLRGGVVIFVLSAIAFAAGALIAAVPASGLLECVFVTILLAQKALVSHVKAVRTALESGIGPARIALSRIVGRDTTQLEESDISRAAVESAAENFSDGIIAPAFWFLLFGLPGIFVYKLVNTADSMIGHLTEEYEAFGKAAAKLDDAMNWIPARISGGLICIVGRKRGAFELMREEAQFHRSPNAGWPEAAMAASLGVALGGRRVYFDKVANDAFINGSARRRMDRDDIGRSVRILWLAWLTALAIVAGAAGVVSIA